MGGLLRCVACGEVHWNLRFSSRRDSTQECRLCGAELKAEPRRFERVLADGRDAVRPTDAAGLGPRPTS